MKQILCEPMHWIIEKRNIGICQPYVSLFRLLSSSRLLRHTIRKSPVVHRFAVAESRLNVRELTVLVDFIVFFLDRLVVAVVIASSSGLLFTSSLRSCFLSNSSGLTSSSASLDGIFVVIIASVFESASGRPEGRGSNRIERRWPRRCNSSDLFEGHGSSPLELSTSYRNQSWHDLRGPRFAHACSKYPWRRQVAGRPITAASLMSLFPQSKSKESFAILSFACIKCKCQLQHLQCLALDNHSHNLVTTSHLFIVKQSS